MDRQPKSYETEQGNLFFLEGADIRRTFEDKELEIVVCLFPCALEGTPGFWVNVDFIRNFSTLDIKEGWIEFKKALNLINNVKIVDKIQELDFID
jgi:hypothetical protein